MHSLDHYDDGDDDDDDDDNDDDDDEFCHDHDHLSIVESPQGHLDTPEKQILLTVSDNSGKLVSLTNANIVDSRTNRDWAEIDRSSR